MKAAAGSGITVVGNGSPNRPYQIGQAGDGSINSQIVVSDSPTLNLETSGAGTPSSKLDIHGSVTVKMTQLTDVSDPTPPVNGDVPVWVTDHWEFKPPPTTAPGAVNASHGLTGDGSGPNPLLLKTAMDWLGGASAGGLAPDLRLWGTDSTMGNPVYVDSAGMVRSMPEVISDAQSKLATDLPGAYPQGMSIMSLYTATATSKGWPLGASCTVLTFRRNGDSDANANVSQIWFRSISSLNQVKYRFGNSSGWAAWTDLLYDSGWVDIAINAGFAMQGTEKPQVRNKDGVIYVRGGWNTTGLTVAGNYDVGVVPAGYRPAFTHHMQMGCGLANVNATALLGTTGIINLRVTSPFGNYYMFGGQAWLID